MAVSEHATTVPFTLRWAAQKDAAGVPPPIAAGDAPGADPGAAAAF